MGEDFRAGRPDQKRVSGITTIWTGEGWLYLAVVLGLYPRRVIGWARSDSAYRSKAQGQCLASAGIGSQACEKGTRGKPLAEERKRPNRTKSKAMARGEHWVYAIGLQRAKLKVGLMNLAYNMARFLPLIKRDANAVKRNLGGYHGKGASVMAK